MREIVYKGVTYSSLAELSDAYGVKRSTFNTRRIRGYSIEECIYGRYNLANTKGIRKAKYKLDGKDYCSIKEISKAYGINENVIGRRLKKGYTLEEAVKMDYMDNFIIEYNGEVYKGERELCEKYNVNYYTFRTRKRRGWTLEECLFGKSNVKT